MPCSYCETNGVTSADSGKSGVRSRILAARSARSTAEIDAARQGVRSVVLAHVAAHGAAVRCVAAYLPLRTEPGSIELLDALVAAGLRVLVPLLLADRDLDWTNWAGSSSEPAEALGVDAIRAADLVLVPALAVDARGARLGRGGGSYDRALARVGPDVPIAALLYSGEVLDAVPTDPWDRPVTAAATPAGWIELLGVDGE